MFDVSPLVPEARPLVPEAAQIFYKHLHPWLTGVLVHGSAYKDGFIPNCSDIDIQLYLKAEAFDQEETVPLQLAITIHRELAHIDVAPFQYTQAYTLPDNPTKLMEKRHIRIFTNDSTRVNFEVDKQNFKFREEDGRVVPTLFS